MLKQKFRQPLSRSSTREQLKEEEPGEVRIEKFRFIAKYFH